MIIGAWLFGPAFNIARLIPTSTITPDGVCMLYLMWLSQFWFAFGSIIICVVLFFFPLFFIMSLYLSIFVYLHRKTDIGENSSRQKWQFNKSESKRVKNTYMFDSLIFSLLDLEYFFCISVWYWCKNTDHWSIL